MNRFRRSILVTLVAAIAVGRGPVAAMPASASAIIALIAAAPQLKIDPTVPMVGDLDRKTHPYVSIVGTNGVVGGYADTAEAVLGTLGSGAHVTIVWLISGGSGGIFTAIVFARQAGGPARYAGYIGLGGHLSATLKNGRIVATSPSWNAGEPDCCASHLLARSYTIGSDGKLKLLSEQKVKAPPR